MNLSKEERLCSRSLIEKLFNGDKARSATAFPLRAVFYPEALTSDGARVKMLVSVPKRYFKNAVDRNRVKRQLREAFRKHKTILFAALDKHPDEMLVLAFVWMESKHRESSEMEQKMKNLLHRVAEKYSET